jgi:hypothetical protein
MDDNVIVQRADGRCVGGQLGTGSVSALTGDAAEILLLSMACGASERFTLLATCSRRSSNRRVETFGLWDSRFKLASDDIVNVNSSSSTNPLLATACVSVLRWFATMRAYRHAPLRHDRLRHVM